MKTKHIKILLFSSLLFISWVTTAQLQERFFLTGIVKSVDATKGTIKIEITNEACRGLMEFKVHEDAKADLDNSLIGTRLEFYIESSTCERGKTYTIILQKHP